MSNPGAYSLSFHVRDYECDTGHGVNNAVYLNYFEHARFQFLREHLHWDMEALTKSNIGFVVINLNVEFRRSLVPNDRFVVESTMTRISPRRLHFQQELYIEPRHEAEGIPRKPAVTAKVLCTAINIETGRSEMPPLLEALLIDFPIKSMETASSIP